MCRPVARSGNGGGGVRKTNVDLTSGRWPRWVARYEKGGWAVHFRSDIRKVGRGGGGGGAIRFRSITKSGGAIRFMSITKSGWGGGERAIRFRSITKSGGGGGGQFASGPLRKVGGGGGGAIRFRSITKSEGGGRAIRFRSITKSGRGGISLQVHYEKWGGGGAM